MPSREAASGISLKLDPNQIVIAPDPFWLYNGAIMAVNLSIKNVPPSIVQQLRKRAQKNHRSLQGELLTILEESLEGMKKLSRSN